MSWSINIKGTTDRVREAIAAYTPTDKSSVEEFNEIRPTLLALTNLKVHQGATIECTASGSTYSGGKRAMGSCSIHVRSIAGLLI